MLSKPVRSDNYGIDKIVQPYFVEIRMIGSFQEINEALKEIGRCFYSSKEIVQVAHLLKKRGRYYICHFKSLLWLDGIIKKEAITDKNLAEALFALDYLESSGLVLLIGNRPTLPKEPTNVKYTGGGFKTWKRISKYTFKSPH